MSGTFGKPLRNSVTVDQLMRFYLAYAQELLTVTSFHGGANFVPPILTF